MSTLSGKSVDKTNHGPCLVCGRPILYLGCRFCSPGCNFDFLRSPVGPAAAVMEGDWSDLGPVTDLSMPLVPPSIVEPPPEPLETVNPGPVVSGFMGISSPPDEEPSRPRRTP
jgi:hypothetical protein